MTRSASPWLALAVVVAGACDRGHPREAPAERPAAPGDTGSAAPAAAAALPGCSLTAIPLRLPAAKRVVAIGDLHGDLGAARAVLRAAGAIDAQDRWTGGDLVVVQTGDVLDRGDDDRALLDLIARLEPEARAAGGAIVALLGNHELMNAAGDFRYVTPGGLHAFDDAPGPAAALPPNVPAQVLHRAQALAPGGGYAKQLAHHDAIVIVGDTAFSHAGIPAEWATRVDDANLRARCWLDGQASEPPALLTDDEGPVWTRRFGGDHVDCAQVKAALDVLHVQRMVVGHTPQRTGMNSVCDGALWRIDVGLSKAYGGPIEALELTPTGAQVLHGTR